MYATALALLLLGPAVLLATPRLLVRAAAVVLMTLGLLLGFAASILHGLSGGSQGVVDRTVSPDGGHELFEHRQAMIDDAYDVKLRSQQGLLPREVLVWRAVEALQPAARFTGASEIEADAELRRASASCTAPRATRAPSGSLRSTASARAAERPAPRAGADRGGGP